MASPKTSSSVSYLFTNMWHQYQNAFNKTNHFLTGRLQLKHGIMPFHKMQI